MTSESPRRAGARAFGVALGAAISQRRYPKRRLAVDAGVARSAIANYLAGLNLPTMQTARRLSEVLDKPELLDVMARTREYVCPIDQVRFTFNGQSRRTYCSPECQRVAEKMRNGKPRRQAADSAIRRVALFAGAVGAMCRECQPDGACVTPDCPLRSVSPLPLVLTEKLEKRIRQDAQRDAALRLREAAERRREWADGAAALDAAVVTSAIRAQQR